MGFFSTWFFHLGTIIALSVVAGSAVSVTAQTSLSSSAQSWTTTSQTVSGDTSQNFTNNANPSRTTESHVQSGNRTLDRKTVEVLGLGGEYEPYFEVETETIRDSDAATRSITRTYTPDGEGREELTKMREAETQTSTDGSSRTVETTSNADPDGSLHVVERAITATTKGPESSDTQTIVYLPNIEGNLAAMSQIQEQQDRGANGSRQVRTTTLVPDATGNWQVYEVQESTIKGDAQNQTSEERTSRRDFEGNVSPISEVVAKDTKVNGQETRTAETYLVDIPGSARSDTLRPFQQDTTVRTTEPGRTVTEQILEQPVPGAPDAGLGTLVRTKDVEVIGSSGAEETITVNAQYPDGYPSMVTVETRKSDHVPAAPESAEPSR